MSWDFFFYLRWSETHEHKLMNMHMHMQVRVPVSVCSHSHAAPTHVHPASSSRGKSTFHMPLVRSCLCAWSCWCCCYGGGYTHPEPAMLARLTLILLLFLAIGQPKNGIYHSQKAKGEHRPPSAWSFHGLAAAAAAVRGDFGAVTHLPKLQLPRFGLWVSAQCSLTVECTQLVSAGWCCS